MLFALLSAVSVTLASNSSGQSGSQLFSEAVAPHHVTASNTETIPKPVLAALIAVFKYEPRIANPGDYFEDTDVSYRGAPVRRLVAAAGTPDAWLVYWNCPDCEHTWLS